ncbi:hypothetical protein BGZ97_004980 [Linnemannia gamsii]|uniref:Uncharacterized protein n=1 Tax=Linnemannia gamsii TaxID=64522 RepID=A0A9P6QV37_9FUNG|nr:hypothetical protein BGZ97_004980 [Linnemannia gamsii]
MKVTSIFALVAVAATLVSAAPSPPFDRPPANKTRGHPPRRPIENPPPYILISDRNRNGTSVNGTDNGLAKASLPCRSSTLTWWSLHLDGDAPTEQIHSFKLEVDSPVPYRPENTEQEWTWAEDNYFLRQWSWYKTYYVDHYNVVDNNDAIIFVTNGYGYDYYKFNTRFTRRIWSDHWQRYGSSVNTIYYDCIRWRD